MTAALSARGTFVVVVGVTLAGQFGAVAYEVVAAARFGTGRDADALALALMLALTVANEVVAWVSTLFVPLYIRTETEGGPAAAARLLRTGLLAVGGLVGVLALGLAVGAGGLVALLAPGGDVAASARRLVGLFAPLVILAPVAAMLAGVLQAHGRFVAAALRQLCWYGAALVALVLFVSRLGVASVPVGMVAGFAVFCALLAAGVRRTAPVSGAGGGGALDVRTLVAMLPLLALASGANYVNVAVERGIAAHLPEGSLAALTYAFRLLNLPVNLFLLNAATMLFTPLARAAAAGEMAASRDLVQRALHLALLFTTPLAALGLALAQPVVRVLLERGAFTAGSTELTAAALGLYAPAVVGMAGVHVLTRAYQALWEIRRLAWSNVAVILVNVPLMFGLTALLGFRGLPVATSINWILLFVVMLAGIAPRLPGLDCAGLMAAAVRASTASAVAGGVAWVVGGHGAAGARDLLMGGVAGLAAYVLVLWLLSRSDVRTVVEFLAPGWVRRLGARGQR
ncbi:MAG: hypothetical protein HY614_05105 [Candidatus Rokubacteria bacterium]|nr:hypothetical protein [Candidatus Rokubacteria bacterium]